MTKKDLKTIWYCVEAGVVLLGILNLVNGLCYLLTGTGMGW